MPERKEIQPGDGAIDKQPKSYSSAPPPDDLATKTLIVWRSRTGDHGMYWTREYGDIPIPPDWEFLPPGNAFVTRRVKKGPHWVLIGTYNRRGGYTPVLGIFAPAVAIQTAKAADAASAAERSQARSSAQKQRDKAEAQYRKEFEDACMRFLDFAPMHQELAKEIAQQATQVACEKHSGRVGRTSLIPLADKVSLAVRAYIRHSHTDYESSLPQSRGFLDHDVYLDARKAAHADVTRFLDEHRAKT